jgi:hypothetical protein
MRGGKGAFAVLVALAALLIVAVPATSAHELRIQTSINPSGRTGSLSVASPPGSIGWEACTAKLTECVPWGRGFQTETHSAPAGTIFRVRNAEGETGLSPEWRGPLKEMAPPRVSGVIQANDYVSPVRGLWAGGWREEPSEMQLSACETGTGEGCISLTSRRYIRQGCAGNQGFLINARFAGWYLRVADKQSGGPHAEPSSAVYSPSGATWGFDGVWGRSRTVGVAVVGQIAPAVNPPAGECGPPPPPVATISADGVARVECAAGCRVSLAGTRAGRRRLVKGYMGSLNLLQPLAPRELQLTHPMLTSLGRGKIRLTVEIEGARLVQRTIRTPNS